MKFRLTITTPRDGLDKIYELPFVTNKSEDDGKFLYNIGDADISTIDEIIQLLNAMDEIGIRQEIVIGRHNRQSPLYIEIYNDYRE